MHAIVVGSGRVGSRLATYLSMEGHDVVVVDRDARSFERLGSTFNGVTLPGLGFDEDVLREAGAEHADILAAVTDLDNTNLMAAEVAKRLFGVKHVVARLMDPAREKMYRHFDLDYVCGTTLVVESILDKLRAGHEHHLLALGQVELVTFAAGPAADGRMVAELERTREFRVCAVTRDNASFVPEAGTILRAGDVVTGAVRRDAFSHVEQFVER